MAKANINLRVELENRILFERLLAELSAHFISLSADQVDIEIENAQRRVCECLNLDRSTFWQIPEQDSSSMLLMHMQQFHEGLPATERLNASDLFPWTMQKILAGEMVTITKMSDLLPEAGRDKESFDLYGTKSVVVIPLSVGGAQPFGCLTFAMMREERQWPETVLDGLQLITRVFANAIARKRADKALCESELRLNLAADSAEAGLWMLNISTGVFWLTDRTRELFSYPSDREINLNYFINIVHPDDREQVRKTIDHAQNSKKKVEVEYRIVRPDGSIRWMASRGRIQSDNSEESNRLMGVSVDITERKQLQEQVENAAEEWQDTFDTIQDLIMVLDCEGRIIRANRAMESFLDIPPEQITGSHCYTLMHTASMPFEGCSVTKALETKQYLDAEVYIDGKDVWLLISVSPILDDKGTVTSFVYAAKDITERKRAMEKLSENRDALRVFTSRLLTIQEEERRRLARELHDDFTQRLAVLAMDMSRMELSAKAANTTFEPDIRDIRDQIVKLSTDIHDVSRQLHPSIIDDLGLGRAIQSECASFTRRTGIGIDYKPSCVPLMIHRDISVGLFRITQEALRNIQKHAQTKEAEVVLVGEEGYITLMIHDSGAGFDTESKKQIHGLGLFSMEERVQLMHGVFSIFSAPGHGTQIKVVVPF